MAPSSRRCIRSLLAFVALGATTLTAGCAGSAPVLMPGPHRTATSLDDREIGAIARLLRYEDRRTFDAGAFAGIMDGAGEEVRRRGAMAAGRTGDTAAVPFLLGLLSSDPSFAVRADAAFALGELGAGSAPVLDSLDGAVSGDWVPIREEAVPVVVEVLGALGKLGGTRARTLVRDALREARRGDTDRHTRVAAEALLTVWRFDDGPGNVRAVAPYLSVEDPELRWRAAYSLMRGGHTAALPLLLALRDDPEHRVRAYTARALDAATADSAGVADQAVARLTGWLSDPHPHVRINALGSLGGYADRAPLDAMAALIRDPVASVGVAAARALARLGERAADPLAAALDDPELPVPLRGAILAQLAAVAPERAEPAVDRWAQGNASERYFAARSRQAAAEPEDGGDARPETVADEGPGFYEDIVRRYIAAPLAGSRRPTATIETAHGPILIELLAEEAPLTVHNFMTLAQSGFFDDGVWHRVVPNFVLQDGAPGGLPGGGPGWTIRDEINRVRYDRGVLGMALSGPDTGGSQWFITHSPQPHLDGGYTVFGRVIDGMDAADAVLQGESIPAVRVRP